MGENGCIAHHRDGLAVVLTSLHEHGFADSGIHITPPTAILCHCVLAHIDVRGRFRVIVVASVLTDEEVWGVVVVLVLQFHRFGYVVEVVAVCNQMQIRPSGLDGGVELHVAFHIVVAVEHELLLVSYFHIFKVERIGMAVLCTHASIEGISCRAIGILDGIECFLNEGVDVILVHLPIMP